jgi:hypothetical protein
MSYFDLPLLFKTPALKQRCLDAVHQYGQFESSCGYDERLGLMATYKIQKCVSSTIPIWPAPIFSMLVRYKMSIAYDRADGEGEYSNEQSSMSGAISAVEDEMSNLLLWPIYRAVSPYVCCPVSWLYAAGLYLYFTLR